MGTRQIEHTLADGESLHDIEDRLDHAEMCGDARPGTVDIDVPGRIADEPKVDMLGDVCDQLLRIINSLTLGPQSESVRRTVQALQQAQAICRQSILLDTTDPSRIEQDAKRGIEAIRKARAS